METTIIGYIGVRYDTPDHSHSLFMCRLLYFFVLNLLVIDLCCEAAVYQAGAARLTASKPGRIQEQKPESTSLQALGQLHALLLLL